MEEDDIKNIVSDEDSDDCQCIHYNAVKIIQKCFRRWYKCSGYQEFIAYWERNLLIIQWHFMAKFTIA